MITYVLSIVSRIFRAIIVIEQLWIVPHVRVSVVVLNLPVFVILMHCPWRSILAPIPP